MGTLSIAHSAADFDAYVLELTEAAVNEALSILNSTMPAEAPLLVRLNQVCLYVSPVRALHSSTGEALTMASQDR